MQIFPLSEGRFTVDKTKQFVPFNEKEDVLTERPTGSLLVEIQPFVVITSRDILLLDTGLGFASENGSLQLHENLKKVGVEPAAVTKVFLSHLHKDHAGGVGGKELSFPSATYYVQQKELELAFEKGPPTYITEDLQALSNARRVVLLNGDGHIEDYMEYKLSSAHSPWHQVCWLREKGETVFFGGDEAPQLQQMKHRFVAKYDFNGKKATELRRQWWEQGGKEGWTFLFYHDITSAIVKRRG